MKFKTKSRLVALGLVAVSVFVGLEVGKYDTTYGAIAMILMYLSLAVTIKALGKLKHA